MRAGNRSSEVTPKESGSGGGKNRRNKNQQPKQEVAKVVTAESAEQINSLVAQIAASTLGEHDVAPPSEDKTLDAVLGALPEGSAPGSSKRKSKRVTSGGIVTPQSDNPSEKSE
jgi:hypothetical protein